MSLTQDEADVLITTLAEFRYDPVGFAYWAFPWGEPGELEDYSGPLAWQIEVLRQIRDGLVTIEEAIRIARTSGHGIGKSALVSIIILWAMSTCAGAKGVITANTDNQLRTKTHPEFSKWFRLFIANPLFKLTATALYAADPEMEKEWRMDFIPWSEKNPAAFAGLHNKGKRILIIFDEASEIADIIWETILGALTDRDTEIIWCVFGNPTRNTGAFRDCFEGGKRAKRWQSKTISSLDVEITNHKELQSILDDFGADSDVARVRVLGRFPRTDSESFMSAQLVEDAIAREVRYYPHEPIVIGVDPARFGDDATVMIARQGLDAETHGAELHYGLNTMEVASRALQMQQRLNAVAIFVDEGGLGAGVVDRLMQLGAPVIPVNFSNKPKDLALTAGVAFANHRAEIWGALREWLSRGSIPEKVQNESLKDELLAPHYKMDAKERIQLESKREMRIRGVKSPNIADALACTFSEPVLETAGVGGVGAEVPEDNYNPFDLERIYA